MRESKKEYRGFKKERKEGVGSLTRERESILKKKSRSRLERERERERERMIKRRKKRSCWISHQRENILEENLAGQD